MSDVKQAHQAEYAAPNLGERIVAVLEEAGILPENWVPDILGPADQIHGGGLQQTQSHADLVEIAPDMHLLDIGCGIGGPARYFATAYDCRVTGIDLTDEYIEAANLLTQKVGLADRVSFDCGDATDLPYDDGAFDMAWALNVTMNIQDRAGFYAEVRRVLKPGGKFCISEIGQGPGGEPYYPLTWAADPAYSFLLPPDEMRALLEAAGFRIVEWIDETARRKTSADGRPTAEATPVETPLTIEITRGADYPDRRKNSGRSAKEGRLTNVMLVAEKV
jgi:ubiquinone/menaquinone biosynthesis C-methylase UbiE